MPSDLERLQGTWTVTSFETDGQKMAPGAFAGSRIVIKGNSFTSIGMGATYVGTVELDRVKKQKIFRVLFTAGHAAGARQLGIYKLAGDTWTICLATHGSKPPAGFATKRGTGSALQTLRRGQTGKAMKVSTRAAVERDALPSGAATEWEGDWAMVGGVFNGAAMAADMVTWCRRITRGDITSVVAGPQMMLRARFTLDASKTPHAVDYMNLEGANKRKPQAGIFELSGETLRVCMAAPGKPRPAAFSSKAGDGRSYTTWTRTRR